MIIFNRIIPFKGFNAMNLFGIIFVRKGGVVNKVVLNHERIHTRQQIEMLVLPFYLWYIVEWLIRLIISRDFLSQRCFRQHNEPCDAPRSLECRH